MEDFEAINKHILQQAEHESLWFRLLVLVDKFNLDDVRSDPLRMLERCIAPRAAGMAPLKSPSQIQRLTMCIVTTFRTPPHKKSLPVMLHTDISRMLAIHLKVSRVLGCSHLSS